MGKQAQYNLLAGLCIVAFLALSILEKPDAQAMSALALAGTLAGRGSGGDDAAV